MTLPVSSAYAQEAEAQTEPMKVLVGKLSGAKPTSARGWIVEGLEQDPRFDVLPEGDSLSLPTGSAEHRIAAMAGKHEADVVILGFSRFGKGWNAELEIYDGKNGSLIEKVKVKGGSFKNYEDALSSGESFYSVMLTAVGFPPPPPEPVEEEPVEEEEAEEEPVEEEPEEEEEDPSGRPSPLDAELGLGIYGRSFRYTDTLAQLGADVPAPLDYNLDAAPMPFIGVHWYPAAHFTGGWLSHLGVTAGYAQGVGTSVRYEEGGQEFTYSQTHLLYRAGLRGRIPISFATIGLNTNYAGHLFKLNEKDSGDPSQLFPNVNYSTIELGGDVEFRIGRVILGGYASYLLVLGTGDIGSDAWYPNTTATGVNYGGDVGFELSPMFDILLGVDGRAYGLSFNELPDDTPDDKVAGGATDRYLAANLSLRFRLPGTGEASAAAEEAAEESDGLDFD